MLAVSPDLALTLHGTLVSLEVHHQLALISLEFEDALKDLPVLTLTMPGGNSFRHINLAHTDDFGAKNDKIRSWVVNNGGKFSHHLNDEVTHLICSKKAWKEYHATGEGQSAYRAQCPSLGFTSILSRIHRRV